MDSSDPTQAAQQSTAESLGLVPPKQGPDPYAHRRGEPRSFAAMWVLYLFCAIALMLAGLGWTGLAASDIYRPAARLLMLLIASSVWIVWPMVRLSQEAPPNPERAFLADCVLVLAPSLGAIVPQALPWMAAWPAPDCLGLATFLAAWTFLAGAILALTLQQESASMRAGYGQSHAVLRSHRTGVMLAMCVAAILPGVLLFAKQNATTSTASSQITDALLLASPATGMWSLTEPKPWLGQTIHVEPVEWLAISLVAFAAAIAWGLVFARKSRRAACVAQ